ncbi:MAG TPA: serine/threonine-protein kinase, partial [Anaerolineales bacterium]|nr:serine/threonine-protein kinase [Anaerolineales bacterium]
MTLERDSLLKDRYRILEILGQGGMGAVYHARDESLNVEVAVKENLFTSDEYSRQFQREANILATMRHPNLPRVIDHFEIPEQGQYMVMDFIEGEDLRQRMDRVGSLKDEEVIIIGAAICDALEYLHTRKPVILHRDLKPGNIKISPEGQVYLVDFGLAKIVSGNQVTTTGARAMTPGYSSPEQYGTARTDERSDIYSLGATLYAALTNTIPEDGLARAMEQADLTPIRKRNPKISRRTASAVEKALSVHPEDRYQTVGEFKATLLQASNATKQIQHSEELTIPPPPPEVIAEITAGKRLDAKGANEPVISGESGTRRRRK